MTEIDANVSGNRQSWSRTRFAILFLNIYSRPWFYSGAFIPAKLLIHSRLSSGSNLGSERVFLEYEISISRYSNSLWVTDNERTFWVALVNGSVMITEFHCLLCFPSSYLKLEVFSSWEGIQYWIIITFDICFRNIISDANDVFQMLFQFIHSSFNCCYIIVQTNISLCAWKKS